MAVRILSHYSPEQIILNEFRFAESYIKDGVITRFSNLDHYKKLGKIDEVYFSQAKKLASLIGAVV